MYLCVTKNIVKKLLVVLLILFSSCERKLCPTYSSSNPSEIIKTETELS